MKENRIDVDFEDKSAIRGNVMYNFLLKKNEIRWNNNNKPYRKKGNDANTELDNSGLY